VSSTSSCAIREEPTGHNKKARTFRIALEGGIRTVEARLAWLEDALAEIESDAWRRLDPAEPAQLRQRSASQRRRPGLRRARSTVVRVQPGLEREADRAVHLLCARGHVAAGGARPAELTVLIVTSLTDRGPGEAG
jgi:hypothetical protein